MFCIYISGKFFFMCLLKLKIFTKKVIYSDYFKIIIFSHYFKEKLETDQYIILEYELKFFLIKEIMLVLIVYFKAILLINNKKRIFFLIY